ncbi:uncharacterized protein LOC122512425 [Leptopilina heterotoma]|uniref:uncharacterized protein LOC122512425 n=1 Tax=Leptopilina heterotoma TaxID=63436 RepID=UPI001CA7E6F0|nr:uncharacterized protein LOC122512425 [Leptopilina heterotoma]
MNSNDQENSEGIENLPLVLDEGSQSPLDRINDSEDSNQEQIQAHNVPSIDGRSIDPVRQYMLQKHLVLLIHAQTCLEDESERNIPAENCRVAFCDVMRNVLKHMDTCLEGINCTYELCSSSQLLLYHLQNCGQRSCPLCAPFVDIDVLLTSDTEDSPRQSSSDAEISENSQENDGSRREERRRRNNSVFNQQDAASSLEQILHSPNGIARWVENTRKMVQLNWQLFILLHADKCRAHRSLLSCPTPNCQELRAALNHMPNCHLGVSCTFSHCWASRQIINHWTNCRLNICPLCVPIRQLEGVRNRNFFSSIVSRNPPLRPLVTTNQASSSQRNPRGGNLTEENRNNAPAVGGQGLPLLIRVNHGASCSLSTSASGAIQLCSSAEHHYQQSGLMFTNENPPPRQMDVSPPGVRVGSLPGYGPDDTSPPGVRIGSLPGYGPNDVSPPGRRIGSDDGHNPEAGADGQENNQSLLRVCSHDNLSKSSLEKIDDDHVTRTLNFDRTLNSPNQMENSSEAQMLSDATVNRDAINEPEMQSLTGTMSRLSVPESKKELIDKESLTPNKAANLSSEKTTIKNSENELDSTEISKQNSSSDREPKEEFEPKKAEMVVNGKDCERTGKSDSDEL